MDIEAEIQERGQEILRLARIQEAEIGKTRKWENALLEWCMKDDDTKMQIFRFIDVFPEASNAKEAVTFLREYFPKGNNRLPKAIRLGTSLADSGLPTKQIVYQTMNMMFRKISSLFIACSGENEAMEFVRELSGKNIRASLDLLGERTASFKEADVYFSRYIQLIKGFDSEGMFLQDRNVSVKLSSLDPLFDPADPDGVYRRVGSKLTKLFKAAAEHQVFIHIDMEEYAVRDLTLEVVERVAAQPEFAEGINIGVVLQAYLKDADSVLDRIIRWSESLVNPLVIRLVRGAYWDQEILWARESNWPIPVFEEKTQTDAMFEQLACRILDLSPKLQLACATHNIRSITKVMIEAEARSLDKSDYEFQVLYGMGDALAKVLSELGYIPRVYAPIGDSVLGMAYLVRRLLENVSSQSFIQHGFHTSTDANELLKKPEASAAAPFDVRTFECPPLQMFNRSVLKEYADTVERVRKQLGSHLPIVIGGKSIRKDCVMENLSRTDNRTCIARASKATREDADLAVLKAKQSLQQWSQTPVKIRAEKLRTAAEWMKEHRLQMAAVQIHEVGKPYREADMDVKEAIDFLTFYADSAEEAGDANQLYSLPHEKNTSHPVPRGVTAVISPWNFPQAILTGMSSAALVTGNPVILKPAEQSVLCAWMVYGAYKHAGIPEGVIQLLYGPGEEIGDALVKHPEVATVAFTGSKEVGLSISEDAGAVKKPSQMKKLIIEMGGKNSMIIDISADQDAAIPAVLNSAFGFAGQKCSALSRLIVVDSLYERFINRLTDAAESYPFGDILNPVTACGPVIDQSAYEKIESFKELARREGRVLFEAEKPEGLHLHYVAPLIVDSLKSDSPLLREEIFGPVLCVVRAKDLKDAVWIANQSEFGLTGGVFSRIPSHLEYVRKNLNVGNLYINRGITGALVGRQPFGGLKLSGTGAKAGGREYLKEFISYRTVSENLSRHGFAPSE